MHCKLAIRRTAKLHAFSLIECIVATAVIALFLSGAFALNSHGMLLLRSSKESTAAEQASRDRLEKMRNAPWERMVDPTYISDTVLASTGNTFPDLGGLTITINVTAYPPPGGTTGATPITVVRNASGTVSVVSAGSNQMVNEKTVSVKVTIGWTTTQRTRLREAYTLVSKGGISGRNK